MQRDKLYKPIEYIPRGPISNKRLEITKAGLVKLELKTPWSNGTTHLLFTKEEFLEKLTTLIPPPRSYLVRWNGIFRSNSHIRKKIILKPQVKKGFQFKDDSIHQDTDKTKQLNHAWSKMLAKVFKIDVTNCCHSPCKGKLQALGAIQDFEEIVRYLKHQGIDYEPPPRAPPKYRQQSAKGFDPDEPYDCGHIDE